MKVSCPNCGRAQEITLSTDDQATRAQCDSCHTVFLVRVKARNRQEGSPGPYNWYVRKVDSTLLSFPGDAQLHEAIRKGLVELEDEISADGRNWNRISALPILRAFLERWQSAEPEQSLQTEPMVAPAPETPPPAPTVAKPTVKAGRRGVPADISSKPTIVMDTQAVIAGMEEERTREVPVPPEQNQSPAERASDGIPEHLTGTSPTATLPEAPLPPSARAQGEWEADWSHADPPSGDPEEMTNLVGYARRGNRIVGVVIILFALAALAYGAVAFFNWRSGQPSNDSSPKSQGSQAKTPPPATPAGEDAKELSAPDAADKAAVLTDVVESQEISLPDELDEPQPALDATSTLADAEVASVALPDAVTTEVAGADASEMANETAGDAGIPDVAVEEVVEEIAEGEDTSNIDVNEVVEDVQPEQPAPVETVHKSAPKVHKKSADSDRAAAQEKRRERREQRHKATREESPSKARGYDGYMLAGLKAFKAGNYSAALNAYRNALAAKPGNAEVQHKMAECYRKMGNCSQAIKHYETAIAATGFYSSYIGIARCYKSSGNKDKAVNYLRQGLDRYPGNSSIQRLLDQYAN